MPKPARPWTVLPHGPIEKLDANLWTVAGDLPRVPVKGIRRMSIVRRSDGSLLFFHAIPLDQKTLAEVREWGQPAVLVVPHDQHTVDARAFAEKLALRVFGPTLNEKKLRPRVDLAGTLEQLEADPCVTFESLAGTKTAKLSASFAVASVSACSSPMRSRPSRRKRCRWSSAFSGWAVARKSRHPSSFFS
jgi:hypothetical protein